MESTTVPASNALHNYIDKWTCIAMMNKNCSLLDSEHLGFSKTKSQSKVAAFSLDYKFDPNVHKQVSWLYLDLEPDKSQFDSVYSLEEVVSRIDCKRMFWTEDSRPSYALPGPSMREWRGTVNKWKRIEKDGRLVVERLDSSSLQETVDMVEKWRHLDNGGMKYGWQERAGCDKALVKRYIDNFEGIQDYVTGTVFRLDGEVVGYSCIEKTSLTAVDGLPEFKYLTRKVLSTSGRRNLTEYVDYKTLELVHEANPRIKTFLVNWGASSGGVLWYKKHKFPLYSLETKWFASKKGQLVA